MGADNIFFVQPKHENSIKKTVFFLLYCSQRKIPTKPKHTLFHRPWKWTSQIGQDTYISALVPCPKRRPEALVILRFRTVRDRLFVATEFHLSIQSAQSHKTRLKMKTLPFRSGLAGIYSKRRAFSCGSVRECAALLCRVDLHRPRSRNVDPDSSDTFEVHIHGTQSATLPLQ